MSDNLFNVQGSTRTSVSTDVTLRCIDANGTMHGLQSRLGFSADDPYAVSLSFPSHPHVRPWVFGRDLLARGLDAPTGDGDVHIWPSLDPSGQTVVVIELSSPHGELIAQVGAHEVRDFVAEMAALVPFGAESSRIDLDALVADLLS